MTKLRVEVIRYVRDDFPGWVECRLSDASGKVWYFHEKAPVITGEYLNASSEYPRAVFIACEVIGQRLVEDGRSFVLIDTERPWHVEATTGETKFEVRPEQLEGYEGAAS